MAKAEQTEIPGTEQKRIPSLENAAKKFAEKRRLHAVSPLRTPELRM